MQRPSLQGLGLQSSKSTSHLSPVNPAGHTHMYTPLPAGRLTFVAQEAPFRHSQDCTDTWRKRTEAGKCASCLCLITFLYQHCRQTNKQKKLEKKHKKEENKQHLYINS